MYTPLGRQVSSTQQVLPFLRRGCAESCVAPVTYLGICLGLDFVCCFVERLVGLGKSPAPVASGYQDT
jgi:hypothetical protein